MTTFLTTQQVQTLLQVDRTTVYRLVERDSLPAVRVGKQWRFRAEDVERWLGEQSALAGSSAHGAPRSDERAELADMLPLACVQRIQDVFADILGVTVVLVDLAGRPITRASHPCGLYTALEESGAVTTACFPGWHDLVADPVLEPRFVASPSGLLVARAFVRSGATLKGMLVIAGIAPTDWPPASAALDTLALSLGVAPKLLSDHVDEVHVLDADGRARALRAVQPVADVVTHIAEDRQHLCGRLAAIATMAADTLPPGRTE